MDSIFERLVLQEVERLDPHASTGRPRALSDEQTLCHIFRVLRTGMQWREVETEVSHTTILRRMHIWRTRGVFTTAYRNLIRTYKKLYPTQYYCMEYLRHCRYDNRRTLTSCIVHEKFGYTHRQKPRCLSTCTIAGPRDLIAPNGDGSNGMCTVGSVAVPSRPKPPSPRTSHGTPIPVSFRATRPAPSSPRAGRATTSPTPATTPPFDTRALPPPILDGGLVFAFDPKISGQGDGRRRPRAHVHEHAGSVRLAPQCDLLLVVRRGLRHHVVRTRRPPRMNALSHRCVCRR